MTSGELGTIAGAILTGLSGIGAVVKWAASRIANAIESGNEERHKVIDRNTNALIVVSATMARVEGLVTAARDASVKTEAAAVKTQEAVEEVADEVTGNHEIVPIEMFDEKPAPPPVPKKTPVGGYQILRVPRKGPRS